MSEGKILKATICKKYFDLILSGKKKIEYRDIKPFWTKRLYDDAGNLKDYDLIELRNGYNKDSPKIQVEFKGVKKMILKEDVGMTKGVEVYGILLGKVVKKENC